MAAPRRSRSRSGSRTPSRSRTRSRTPLSRRSRTPRSASRSLSRTPSRSRSRSRSASPTGLGDSGWDAATVDYDEFVPADEETPTFKLHDSTIDLIRTKVYQAPALGQKYFNDLKKERYMLARETHETLEPKPIPAQVVSSVGGMDLNRLHGSMLTLHGISRIAHRPVWALMEELQKTRGNIKKLPMANFVSPPFMTGPGQILPAGHVDLDYPEDERLRHMAKFPQNPSQQDVKDIYESLGVYKKYHEVASKAMVSMAAFIQDQQVARGRVKESLDTMWSRTQDFLNMARYQETHLKEMRRIQLVKQHTKEFTDWFESVYMKDRDRLGARDQSDEILAADYDDVIKLFNEYRKNKNTALRSSHFPKRTTASTSGGIRKEQSGRDKDRNKPRDNAPRRGDNPRQPPHRASNKGQRTRKKGAASDAKDSAPPPPPKKRNDKDRTA